ncbi:MAG TPA: carboxypeptidase regulatory-like domain-containing protein [Candidatus Tumulicola sp.]|nr:carboxypeptidase regulatory-like domain-containing protein [Candidatus Tumulicola sp.]
MMQRAVLGMVLLFALGDSCTPSPNVVGVQDYGQVTGRVLDAMTNRPIANALVSVGSLYTASADARGAFVLGRVPAGDQTVTGRAPGYSTGSADVTVLKDKTVSAGYVRLVPLIHPEGQPTLPPPATPTPQPSPTPGGSPSAAPTQEPAPGIAPTPGGTPAIQPTPTPTAAAVPITSPTPTAS